MIYCSIHSDHRGGVATIKLWPTYAHARTDIHLWAGKLENKGMEVSKKVVDDGKLKKLVLIPTGRMQEKTNRARVLTVHRIPGQVFQERTKVFQIPQWISYNTFTHEISCLGTYTDARVHLTNYALVSKEYADFNWLTASEHKIFQQAYDDLEAVQNDEKSHFSVELEKGSVIFFRIAKHTLLGTTVRRAFLESWNRQSSLPEFITHEMV